MYCNTFVYLSGCKGMDEGGDKMDLTVKNTKEKIPKMQESIEAVKLIIESLVRKEEDLEDEINDTFDQVVALIEERRSCLLNQLHSRISSTREKLGKFECILNRAQIN